MSRFYFQWLGNKRNELKPIHNIIDWDKFDTVVEPFCGSAALTLDLYAKAIDKNQPPKRYVLNDTDPVLIGMLRYVAQNGSEPLFEYCRSRLTPEEWNKHNKEKPEDPCGWFYTHRIRETFGREKLPKKWPRLERTARQIASDAAFAAAEITLGDWRACVDKYKDDPKALIFLDPPYFNSFNQTYYGYDKVKTAPDGRILDGTELFMEMLEYLQTSAATIVAITNSCAIIDHIFKPFIKTSYAKKYAGVVKIDGKYVNKRTNHILIVGGARSA